MLHIDREGIDDGGLLGSKVGNLGPTVGLSLGESDANPNPRLNFLQATFNCLVSTIESKGGVLFSFCVDSEEVGDGSEFVNIVSSRDFQKVSG